MVPNMSIVKVAMVTIAEHHVHTCSNDHVDVEDTHEAHSEASQFVWRRNTMSESGVTVGKLH
jgi:hypothetical protein